MYGVNNETKTYKVGKQGNLTSDIITLQTESYIFKTEFYLLFKIFTTSFSKKKKKIFFRKVTSFELVKFLSKHYKSHGNMIEE